jgi:hypothetical protein
MGETIHSLFEAVPLLSPVLSLVALVFSIYSFRGNSRENLRPILIFSNDAVSADAKTIWFVENVGKGPAINVLLTGGDAHAIADDEEWTRFPALAAGSKENLSAFRLRKSFVAYYTDVSGSSYRSICVDNINTIDRQRPNTNIVVRRSLYDIRMNRTPK